MRYRLVMCALLFAASAHAAPTSSGLNVETDSPDALCPDLGTTRQAIHDRLGTLALEGDEQGWTARYTVGHAPGAEGDFVRLVLIDPSGTQRLVRDLPSGGTSCATLAQAIALVVERYFRELTPGTEAVALPSAPPAETVTRVEPVPPPLSPAPEAPLTPRFALGLDFGFASAAPGPVAGVRAGYFLLPGVHLELSASANLSAHTEQFHGVELELRSYPVALALGFGQRGKIWDFFAGPEARWALETPRGSALQHFDSSPGAAFSAGLGGGLNYWPARALGVTLRGSLDYALAETKYRVDLGPDQPPEQVLKQPKLQGIVTIGLVWGQRP